MLPQIFLFSSTLILGSLISLSSTNWIIVWFGLELNIFSFIPLIFSSSITRHTEAAVKYFIAQVVGSSLLLLRRIFSWSPNSEYLYFLIIIFSLAFKLGLAPCHFWFPAVIASLSWTICLVLATWQKLVPLFLIIFQMSSHQPTPLFLIAGINSLVGGIGGLNQTQLRPLFAYSSINHMGWVVGGSIGSTSFPLIYFLIYCIITSAIFLILEFFSQVSTLSFSPIIAFTTSIKITFTILIITLAGIPPFIGFFSKWIILSSLIQTNLLLIAIPLILGSAISLVYYFNVIISVILVKPVPQVHFSNKLFWVTFLSISAISSLCLIPILILISALATVN